jgi:hypothetical protein
LLAPGRAPAGWPALTEAPGCPAALQASYRLAEGIPPKAVEDESQSLEAAGLLNSVLVQKAA